MSKSVKPHYIPNSILRIFIIILSLLFCIMGNSINHVYASESTDETIAVYFYSTTCESCYETGEFFDQNAAKNRVSVKKMNIYEEDNIDLLTAYCQVYQVSEAEANNVPIVFIGNTYLQGSANIKTKFLSVLEQENYANARLPEEILESSAYAKSNTSIDLLKLCSSALVNSLNPCSFSMMLFLLIALASRKSKHILRVGLSFCIGKTISFFLLGTILFRSFAYIENTNLLRFVNIVLLGLYTILLLENLYDFINIVLGRKKDFAAQIPASFRKFNHNLIRKAANYDNGIILSVIGIAIGALIACTEFLCSGQIYLMTIVNMIHSTNTQYSLGTAMGYMLLYSVLCGLPLFLIVLMVSRGKNAFEMSVKFTDKLVYIKLLNVLFFLGFIIYTIMKGI